MDLKQYADLILKSESAYAAVRDRIDKKMLIAFRVGDTAKRETISHLMNATDVFMSELRIILSEGDMNE